MMIVVVYRGNLFVSRHMKEYAKTNPTVMGLLRNNKMELMRGKINKNKTLIALKYPSFKKLKLTGSRTTRHKMVMPSYKCKTPYKNYYNPRNKFRVVLMAQ
jgi:hypothetical protein